MNWRTVLLVVYGLLLFVGGMIGFATAHSLPSLIMGTISTLIVFICAWGFLKAKPWAFLASQAISWTLTAFFSYRFFITFKIMPAGMMSIISLIVAGTLLLARNKEQALNRNH
jgi:uncharacterized membrane protein (UPF0136 family)